MSNIIVVIVKKAALTAEQVEKLIAHNDGCELDNGYFGYCFENYKWEPTNATIYASRDIDDKGPGNNPLILDYVNKMLIEL